MLPLSENPPTRYPSRPIHESTDKWWVAKVKPRQEKALAHDLVKWDVEYYLPMYTKIARRKDNNKRRKSILCLFPGYLSFCSQIGFEREIYTSNRIVNLVEVKNQSHFKKELEQIYHTLDLGISLEPVDSLMMKPGQLVLVESGPMKGIQGTIVKIHSGHKLIISVDLLGMAAVSIDASLVKAL